jgi:SCP-2 sterol transfer family
VPEFLSERWLRDLDDALRASETVSVLAPIVIEQVVSGVPGRGEVCYRFRIDADGARVTATDAKERPDVRLSTDYETAVAIALGKENAQIALARGRLRLGGDIDVLVRRADALAALDDATVALRAATTYPSP